MAQPVIQTSFNSGEWAPTLNARVDVEKYHSGATLLENFFVDYRGGATASPGTRYVTQTRYATPARLIPFQASFTVSYILEFGEGYIRFINNGAPVLEAAKTVIGISGAVINVNITSHGFSNGDRLYCTGVIGTMGSILNGNYFNAINVSANNFNITDLNGNILSTGLAYTSGGTFARVYTVASPYTASELAQIKYAQNVNTMVLCHPNYPPYKLTLTTATNWSMAPIVFGSTIAAPVIGTITGSMGAGTVNYAYIMTSVDSSGQESAASAIGSLANKLDIRTTPSTITVPFTTVTGAVSYNIYKAEVSYGAAVPAGSMYGFIGNCTASPFIDSNIEPDFSEGVPIPTNPFFGSGVQTITLSAAGNYPAGGPAAGTYPSTFPTVAISGGGGSGATASASGGAIAGQFLGTTLPIFRAGDWMQFDFGVRITVLTTNFAGPGGTQGSILTWQITIPGSIPSGATIPDYAFCTSYSVSSGTNPGLSNQNKMRFAWAVASVGIISPGTGYSTAPSVAFTPSGATATAVLGAPPAGNPTVPGFFQQRLVLAGPVNNPQQINMSQPGAYYNFDITNPVAPANAFSGSLVSGTLNTIQSLMPQPQGLIVLSDQSAWLINGGSAGAPISAINVVANAQVYAGASAPPPLAAVDNILYVQAKGSIVRDLVFSYQKQVYTGADISVLSSHLFYGYQLLEWCWAEEPTKVVYIVRNDGVMLTLTFLKEQELIAWGHRVTQGVFESVATITESSSVGNVNAVYTVVQRVINGVTVQYIERFVEQYYPLGVTDAWQVDAGLRYNGTAALSFTGAQHLAAMSVTGLATDDLGRTTVITPFVMATTGSFTLPAPASPATGYTRVTVGLGYTPKLKTLGIDTGNPTIQGKMKKLPEVTVRVANTLGLSIGTDFDNLVDLEDLIVGNIGKDTNALVTDLVSGDAKQALDPAWTVPGQYCIQQSYPYPATILGLIPQIAVGDTPK